MTHFLSMLQELESIYLTKMYDILLHMNYNFSHLLLQVLLVSLHVIELCLQETCFIRNMATS